MKKPFLWIAYIVLFGFIFACTGCFPHKYTLMYEQSEITSIEIVSLPYGHHYTESLKEETLLGQIEDISAFLNDFSKMEFEYIHPPYDSIVPTIAVKITYRTGDCEWISPHGVSMLRDDFVTFSGTESCDEAQFLAWVESYAKVQIT